MADILNVFHADRRIGQLGFDAEKQLYTFEYEQSWQEDPQTFDLAPLMPRKERIHSGATVRFFFSNLLPEGEMLEMVSRTHGVSKYDPFGLLKKIGAECAGALKILQADTASIDGRTYKAVSTEELSARARVDAADIIANIGGRVRMSLAGVQDKLPAVVDRQGKVFLPDPGSASTHILKPDNRNWKQFPHTAVNEHFCMSLAQKLGLDVPRSFLLSVPERLYAVERFDRIFANAVVMEKGEQAFELQGEAVHRLHQIDVCQLLGLPPAQKYEEPEYDTPPGPGIAQVVEALAQATGQKIAIRRAIIDWVVFNFLIGNSDSHAKNIALLWRGGRWTLAPFYDLLSVAAYSNEPDKLHDFAFTIGGETRYGWIRGASWYDFSTALGVNYRYVQATLNRMSVRIKREAAALLEETAPSMTTDEKSILDRIVSLIRNHASFAEESSRTIADAARSARARAPK